MSSSTNYDKAPSVAVDLSADLCAEGWPEVIERLRGVVGSGRFVLAVECYPGVFIEEIAQALQSGLGCSRILRPEEAFLPPHEIKRLLKPYLTDDPVLGIMNVSRSEISLILSGCSNCENRRLDTVKA